MTAIVVLTPALVRRQVKRGQVYQSGPRRYVRVLGVRTNPPHVLAHRCDAAGRKLEGRHRTGPLAGSPFERFTIYLTWRDGAWRLAPAYRLVSGEQTEMALTPRRSGALSSPQSPRRAATARRASRR